VIGRAYTLISLNFGNAKIGENFTASFGNVTNYNNMFAFIYTQTVSVDKWIPKDGVRLDDNPIRMPTPAVCKDGTCGIR
jgi:hypothetical protein